MALQDIPLPFGEWLPDLGENENPGLVEAKNVIARPGGYAPIKNYVPFTSGSVPISPSILLGAFGYDKGSGSVGFDYGTDTNLYVEGIATSVPAAADAFWSFARFDNSIFAIRPDLTASTESHLWQHAIGATTYTNVSLQGLRGRCLGKVYRFLIIGGCNVATGSAAPDPTSFRWSAFNDPDDFAPSQTTQAGIASVDYPELGPITGVVGIRGTEGLIFQRNAVIRIRYVGPPLVWQQSVISSSIGCVSSKSIVPVGDLVYFMSHFGPCVTDGASVTPLGDNRISKYVTDNYAPGAFGEITTGGNLWGLKSVIWSFNQGTTTSVGSDEYRVFDDHVIYSYETGRFTYSDMRAAGTLVYPLTSAGPKNFVVGLGTGDSGSAQAKELTGSTLAAEITTGYTSLAPGKRVDVTNVEPVYDGSGAKVAINTKQTQAGAAVAGTPVAVNSLGIADVRASGRLAAVSVTFDAGAEWSELKGAVVTADTSGAR